MAISYFRLIWSNSRDAAAGSNFPGDWRTRHGLVMPAAK
jgi:hypothetical protein